MLKKEIKTMAMVRKVANELQKDLEQETSHYTSGYAAVVEHYEAHSTVSFLSSGTSRIITSTAFETCMQVVKSYMLLYKSIDWNLSDVKRAGKDEYYPVVKIYIEKSI